MAEEGSVDGSLPANGKAQRWLHGTAPGRAAGHRRLEISDADDQDDASGKIAAALTPEFSTSPYGDFPAQDFTYSSYSPTPQDGQQHLQLENLDSESSTQNAATGDNAYASNSFAPLPDSSTRNGGYSPTDNGTYFGFRPIADCEKRWSTSPDAPHLIKYRCLSQFHRGWLGRYGLGELGFDVAVALGRLCVGALGQQCVDPLEQLPVDAHLQQ
ncbi:hypothetical protein HDU90_001219 [Geranomyces variabilis]|nr:hypothetical protein HDU90_001219 [Geranomyces variabilis]